MPNAEVILETIEKKRIESTNTHFSEEDVEKATVAGPGP